MDKELGTVTNTFAVGQVTSAVDRAQSMPDSLVSRPAQASCPASAVMQSSTQPQCTYQVTFQTCTCPAAARGQLCKHRVKLMLMLTPVRAGDILTIMGARLGSKHGGWAVLEPLLALQPLDCVPMALSDSPLLQLSPSATSLQPPSPPTASLPDAATAATAVVCPMAAQPQPRQRSAAAMTARVQSDVQCLQQIASDHPALLSTLECIVKAAVSQAQTLVSNLSSEAKSGALHPSAPESFIALPGDNSLQRIDRFGKPTPRSKATPAVQVRLILPLLPGRLLGSSCLMTQLTSTRPAWCA